MYFDFRFVARNLFAYCAWYTIFISQGILWHLVAALTQDEDIDTSLQFFKIAHAWLDWQVESLGGVLLRLCVYAVLTCMGTIALICAFLKSCVWFLGFIGALLLVPLFALRFQPPRPTVPIS